MWRIATVSCLVLVSFSTVNARPWRVPAEAPTIAAAIDLATAGDVVELATGVYHESGLVLKPGLVTLP